ncbi:hypothetical protein [Crinalium epipsammum]|nr:hypothetical protein [Crinalium epipsammum]
MEFFNMYVTKKWAVSATALVIVLLPVKALAYSGGGSVSFSKENNKTKVCVEFTPSVRDAAKVEFLAWIPGGGTMVPLQKEASASCQGYSGLLPRGSKGGSMTVNGAWVAVGNFSVEGGNGCETVARIQAGTIAYSNDPSLVGKQDPQNSESYKWGFVCTNSQSSSTPDSSNQPSPPAPPTSNQSPSPAPSERDSQPSAPATPQQNSLLGIIINGILQLIK